MTDSYDVLADSRYRPEELVATAAEGTLGDLLWRRCRLGATSVAYEFLGTSGEIEVLTYSELAGRAARTAASMVQALAGRMPAGGRPPAALILHPPGLDYVVSLWACILAGVPAVPAYPPGGHGVSSALPRLARLVADSGAALVLSNDAVPTGNAPMAELRSLPVVGAATTGFDGESIDFEVARPAPDDVAIIQYTSGSTAAPRGVVLTHRNLTANLAAIANLFELDLDSRGFVWLPPYHDMGLIGGILTPVSVGFPMRLMSPLHFLKAPSLWLTQIAESGATVSGGPNFAYELLAAKFRGDPATLDLSRWKLAFNGAEPVRSATLHAFADRFRPSGFRPESFLPCYGLAEATLLVSGGRWVPAADRRAPVSCGSAVPGHEVLVVDPASAVALPQGSEGEIWVRGPSVSAGYWRGHDRTAGAETVVDLAGANWLRTGDLGVLRNDELFVSGRIKDVLIRHGRKYHAADLEEAATQGDARLRPVAAAFTVPGAGDEASVLLLERNGSSDDRSTARDAQHRVLAEHGLRLDAVIVAPPRTVPRTSSGKAQRSLCRERFLAGEYDDWVVIGAVAPTATAVTGDSAEASRSTVDDELAEFLAGVLGVVCESECAAHNSLVELGGDSMSAAEIAAIVEQSVGLTTPVELLLVAQTPARVAQDLLAEWQKQGVEPAAVSDILRALSHEAEEEL